LPKRSEEEKKEDEKVPRNFSKPSIARGNDSSVTSLRDKLKRLYVEAQYFGEDSNDDSGTTTTTNDEFSVQSLREQFEQNSNSKQSGEEDDPSVRSIREMFEPSGNKQNGETFNNLRAKFEPKPRGARSLFIATQHQGNNDAQAAPMFKTVHSRLNEWSIRRQSQRNSRLMINQADQRRNSAELNSMVQGNLSRGSNARGGHSGSSGRNDFVSQNLSSHLTAQAEICNDHFNQLTRKDTKESSTESEFSDAVTLNPSYAEVSLLTNPSPHRVSGSHLTAQGGSHVGLGHGLNRKVTKGASTDSDFSGAVTLDPSYVEVSLLSNPSPLRVPGSHWTSQESASNDHANQLTRKDTKESSTESEFSDAVTLNPSYAEVSLLSNPSPIRSLPDINTDRHSDANTSLLLDIAKKVPEINDTTTKSNLPYQEKNREKSRMSNNGSTMKQLPHNVSSDDSDIAFEQHFLSSSAVDGASRHMISQNPFNPASHRKPDSQSQPSLSMSARDSSDRPYIATNAPRLRSQSPHTSPQSMDDNCMFVDASSGSLNDPRVVAESPYASPISVGNNRSSRSIGGNHQIYNSSCGSSSSSSSPHRVVDLSILRAPSSQGSPSSTFQDKRSDCTYHQQLSSNALESTQIQKGDDPAHEERQSENHASSQNPVSLRTPTLSPKQNGVPPMPSPFDENYAAIMESRHKMLLSRQRTLLSRRANREKIQNFQQQGFFGKTNPKSSSRLYVGLQDEEECSHHETGGNNSNSYHSKGAEMSPVKHTRRPNGFWNGKERTHYGLLPDPPEELERPKSPISNEHNSPRRAASPVVNSQAPQKHVASIFAKVKPAFQFGKSALSSPPRNKSEQKQAVLDRLSAVRAARSRRNLAYGEAKDAAAAGSSPWYPKSPTPKLETINNPISSVDSTSEYRFYPHNDSSIDYHLRTRDDDQSLSTNQSNALEYAAQLALD